MSNKLTPPKANIGKAYVASWEDENNTVGWAMPQHLSGGPDIDMPPLTADIHPGERLFLCEIIVKPVLDKKGRPITKIVK